MKNRSVSFLILFTFFCAQNLAAQQQKELTKSFKIVSVPYAVPDNDKLNFANVFFKLGWKSKAPNTIGIQFTNSSYAEHAFKFAIKDLTTKKMVLIDTVHNSCFGSETLRENSIGSIWSGQVDNINDSFSVRVWDKDGDEFDKPAISIKDQQ